MDIGKCCSISKSKCPKEKIEGSWLGINYLCSLLTEALHLNEHEAAKWLAKDELDSVKWLPADWEVIKALKK